VKRKVATFQIMLGGKDPSNACRGNFESALEMEVHDHAVQSSKNIGPIFLEALDYNNSRSVSYRLAAGEVHVGPVRVATFI
jgi:hypothetical protein